MGKRKASSDEEDELVEVREGERERDARDAVDTFEAAELESELDDAVAGPGEQRGWVCRLASINIGRATRFLYWMIFIVGRGNVVRREGTLGGTLGFNRRGVLLASAEEFIFATASHYVRA